MIVFISVWPKAPRHNTFLKVTSKALALTRTHCWWPLACQYSHCKKVKYTKFLGQIFHTSIWHKAHPALKGALQPPGVVVLAVLKPACRPNLCDQGTWFNVELWLILTHASQATHVAKPAELHDLHLPGLKLLSLSCGHNFAPPFTVFLGGFFLQLLGFDPHLLSPV